MTNNIIPSGTTLTLSEPPKLKIQLNTESLTTLLRSNISCHANKMINQELIDQLTAQIIESIDYFINKPDEVL